MMKFLHVSTDSLFLKFNNLVDQKYIPQEGDEVAIYLGEKFDTWYIGIASYLKKEKIWEIKLRDGNFTLMPKAEKKRILKSKK